MHQARLPSGNVNHGPAAARAHECRCYSIAEYRAKAAMEADQLLAARSVGSGQVRREHDLGGGISVRNGGGGRGQCSYCALVARWAVRRPLIRWLADIASCLVGFLVGWFV